MIDGGLNLGRIADVGLDVHGGVSELLRELFSAVGVEVDDDRAPSSAHELADGRLAQTGSSTRD
jgi:hypothetical protein